MQAPTVDCRGGGKGNFEESKNMKRLLAVSILAMCASVALALLQAPTPTPKPVTGFAQSGTIDADLNPLPTPKAAATPKKPGHYSIGFLADNGYISPSVWHVNCHGANKDKCFAFKAEEFGRTLFQIRDGDGPAGEGGPCDLGDLVRAAKAHQKIQDQFVKSLKEDLLSGSNAALLDIAGRLGAASTALRAELARCSPASKGGGK